MLRMLKGKRVEMLKLKIVRINGKRMTLSKANLSQLASIASLGIDLKNMRGEDIGEAAPMMIDIVSQCLHSQRYEVREGTAIDWVNENLKLDALIDQAEAIADKELEKRGDQYADDVSYDKRIDGILNRLVEAQMPDIVFLGDLDVEVLSKLFAQTMPKKKATKQLSKPKGD